MRAIGGLTAILLGLGLMLGSTPALAQPRRGQKPVVHLARKVSNKKTEARKPGRGEPAAVISSAYAAIPAAERRAIQSDLAWLGEYQGPPGGDFDDQRTIEAVKLFQKAIGGKQTGILDQQQRMRLAAAGETHEQAVGFRLIDDPATESRLGIPEKLVSPIGSSATGSSWISGHGQIQIEAFRLSEANLATLFEQEKKSPRGRAVDFSALNPDSFVISGTQGLKYFVVRAEAKDGGVRGVTILYDQATAGIMASVAVAVANSFVGFPDLEAVMAPGQQRAVAYSSAIVVDGRGDLITARQGVAGCEAITVPGFGHAVRIADDGAHDLALIRLFGTRNLAPATLRGDGQGADLTLVGVADPAAQGGGDAVSKQSARLDGDAVEPVPTIGFSGAAAIDAQGRLAGIVVLKTGLDPGSGTAKREAVLVPSAVVRAFLAAHGVAPAAEPRSIERSVMRVICVRK